jgi:C-terminal processing protease CtpA/Prc
MRVFIVFFLLAGAAAAQTTEAQVQAWYQEREAERSRLWRTKQYDQAVELLQQMAANPAVITKWELGLNVKYNLACGYSLAGKKVEALAILRQLVSDAAIDPTKIERDSDFANIRALAAYGEVLTDARKKWEAQKRFWDSPVMMTPYRENLSEDEKLEGLMRFWSEAKYNFAYFDKLIDFDWDAKMVEFLPRVRAARNTAEYYRVLMEFGALLKDGHTGVSAPREVWDEFRAWPALSLAMVEGRMFVSQVYGDEAHNRSGVRHGMELVTVDGLPVREYAAKFVMPLEGGSTDQDRERRGLVFDLLGGKAGSQVRLGLVDEAGRAIETAAARLRRDDWLKLNTRPQKPPFEFRMLNDGRVAYVALNSFGDGKVVSEFERAWPEIRKAPTLILDVRENGGGNSGYGAQILSYLVKKGGDVSTTRTRLYRPAFRAWGYGEGWETRTWRVEAKQGEGYDGRMVLLIGPATFSAAEDFASSFDILNAGALIGEPTGGSTGQPLMFALPGGGTARICTLQEKYADGREFVGVGIQPKVKVAQTVADFRMERDAALEAAVAYLRK